MRAIWSFHYTNWPGYNKQKWLVPRCSLKPSLTVRTLDKLTLKGNVINHWSLLTVFFTNIFLNLAQCFVLLFIYCLQSWQRFNEIKENKEKLFSVSCLWKTFFFTRRFSDWILFKREKSYLPNGFIFCQDFSNHLID